MHFLHLNTLFNLLRVQFYSCHVTQMKTKNLALLIIISQNVCLSAWNVGISDLTVLSITVGYQYIFQSAKGVWKRNCAGPDQTAPVSRRQEVKLPSPHLAELSSFLNIYVFKITMHSTFYLRFSASYFKKFMKRLDSWSSLI